MSETDRRLKDHLNTNQAKRERMCLEILSVQDDYSDVRPRLPKGGPDGGCDLKGSHKESLLFGAVGFVNDATDLSQHRDQIKAKFKEDLENALKTKKRWDLSAECLCLFYKCWSYTRYNFGASEACLREGHQFLRNI